MQIQISPIQSQEKDSCGPTSLAMILQHHGSSATEYELLARHGGIETVTSQGVKGTFVIENATIAAQDGFQVTAYCANSEILGLPRNSENQYIPRELLEERLKTAQGVDKEIIARYLRAKAANVDLMFINPSLMPIRGFLENKIPLHISVDVNQFYDTNRFATSAGHSIVLIGYNKKEFYYADPDTGNIHETYEQHLLESIRTYAKTHSAYLIAITRKFHKEVSQRKEQ